MPREPFFQIRPAYPDYLWRDANEWKAPACAPVADGPGFDPANIGGGGYVGEDVTYICLLICLRHIVTQRYLIAPLGVLIRDKLASLGPYRLRCPGGHRDVKPKRTRLCFAWAAVT